MGFKVYPGIKSLSKSFCNDETLPFNGPDFVEIVKMPLKSSNSISLLPAPYFA